MTPTPTTPAGGGTAAAAFLHEASPVTMAPCVPHPPPGPPSGRPQPAGFPVARDKPAASGVEARRSSIRQRSEDRWLHSLLGLVTKGAEGEAPDSSGSRSVDAVLSKGAALAAQLEELAVELYGVLRVIGVDVPKLCKLFREELFAEQSHCQLSLRRNSLTRAGALSYAYKHILGDPSVEYDLKDKVGQGAFGVVRQARHKPTGEEHAVKSIQNNATVNDSALWNEIETLRHLDHPHIMRLFNTYEDEKSIHMAFELCSGGSFFELLASLKFLLPQTASRLFRQIIGVVSYLHTRQVCHRDIKPENFLVLRKVVGDDLDKVTLKLIDFGTAKRVDLSMMVTKVCTPHYVAPEVLRKGSEPYTEKVDVWSCGVVLFLMVSGHMPFDREKEIDLLRLVKKGVFEFKPAKIWDLLPDSLTNLISGLMTTDPAKRLSAADAYQHRWVQDQHVADDAALSKKLLGQMHAFLTNSRLKRVALHIIARQINDESIEQLRNVFLSMDDDNTGIIEVNEMEEAVKQIGVGEFAQKGMVQIMCELDPTGSGRVHYTEFLAATLSQDLYLQEDVCRAAFVRLDSDGDGVLTRQDVGRLLDEPEAVRSMGLEGANLAELRSELEAIFKASDENGDGGISFEEFMDMMADDAHNSMGDTAVAKRRGRGRKSYANKNFKKLEDIYHDNKLSDIDAKDDDEDEEEEDEEGGQCA